MWYHNGICESCHTCECVKESCHIFECVNESCVTHLNAEGGVTHLNTEESVWRAYIGDYPNRGVY